MTRAVLQGAKRWVVKIGSAVLTDNGVALNVARIRAWAEEIAALRSSGSEVIVVSSGAVAAGMARLGWLDRPSHIDQLQAAAAVGQVGLVQLYQTEFDQHHIQTAQVLLTAADLSNRERYLNARGTLQTLLSHGVLPIINENDTVATDEIRFGDNDTLAGLTANLIEADGLIILTDRDGLYDSDPRENANAALVSHADASDLSLDHMASSSGGRLGRGGMATKVNAARLAARSGTHTVICSGLKSGVITTVIQGGREGSLLSASMAPVAARKRWLAAGLKVMGTVMLDEGAVRVLTESGKSLLAVGVISVTGDFRRGDLVRCVDRQGREYARGLINYGAADAAKICGQPSQLIAEILGFCEDEELIHRDNLVLV